MAKLIDEIQLAWIQSRPLKAHPDGTQWQFCQTIPAGSELAAIFQINAKHYSRDFAKARSRETKNCLKDWDSTSLV
jgi:hypothetical protein